MTINGISYSSPKNINLQGVSSLKGSTLRFARTSSATPFDSTSNGIYVNASNQFVFSSQGSTAIFGSAGATVPGKLITSGTETIAAGGTTTALSLTKTVHYIDADAGGDIFTLAAGTEGQIMTVLMKSSTGTATITPVAMAGGTSVTFNAAGDSVIFQYMDAKWYILGGNSYAVV